MTKRLFKVHKARGTCKVVNVEAESCNIEYGCLVFRNGKTLVMSYAAWAWKTCHEEEN